MALNAIRGSIARIPLIHHAIAVDPPGLAPIALTNVDDDSYQPLASMAQEISRELGGDGLLVTWHENAGEPQYLFADGECEPDSATARGVADIALLANAAEGAARSRWQMLEGDGTSGVLTTSIPAERGVLTIATLFRRIGRSTRMKAGESVARLLPLVQPFFRIWLSRMRTVETVRALTAVVNDSDVGVLLFDRAGRITFSNSIAEDLLRRGQGLHRKGATVTGDTMVDTLRLHDAIEKALSPRTTSHGRSAHRIVALRRRDAPALMAAVVSATGGSGAPGDCAAIVYIVDPDQDLQPLIEPVCNFYGLSPAETRLACNLVAGRSLAEAAEFLHVREQTARSYLKQVFLKTDTNRQAELVRLLLLSAVRAGHVTPDHP